MEQETRPKRYSVANKVDSAFSEAEVHDNLNIFLTRYSELGITTSEAMLIIQLMSFKWTDQNPYPSFTELAKRMGMTPTAVRNHARALQQRGLIRRVPRRGATNEFPPSASLDRLEGFV